MRFTPYQHISTMPRLDQTFKKFTYVTPFSFFFSKERLCFYILNFLQKLSPKQFELSWFYTLPSLLKNFVQQQSRRQNCVRPSDFRTIAVFCYKSNQLQNPHFLCNFFTLLKCSNRKAFLRPKMGFQFLYRRQSQIGEPLHMDWDQIHQIGF